MNKHLAHILIVDDDIRILELIKSYLNKNNFRVSTAKNAGDAREKLDSLEFDLYEKKVSCFIHSINRKRWGRKEFIYNCKLSCEKKYFGKFRRQD